MEASLRGELRGIDEGLSLAVSVADAEEVMAEAEQEIWLGSLHAAPHGVRRMSRQVPGVVETSNNLGMVDVHPNGGSCNFMVRSLIGSGSLTLADEIVSLWALSGTHAEKSGFYPGWAPNPDSALLKLCQSVYLRDFAVESKVQVIHAGLECGIIGDKYPGMDIVSFGPTIRGAHAPGERVEVASVERCWRLLTAILAELR
jgi:dipeptidase D